jgi:hypothetical protein
VPLKDDDNVFKQIAPLGAFKALLPSGLGERLARKAGTQDVVCRHFCEYFADVTSGLKTEIPLVKVGELGIDL